VTRDCTPVQTVSIDGPTTALSGTAITLYASYTPADATGAALTWDNGTVGSSAQYVWSEVGVHTVVVTATGACGAPVTATYAVTVTSMCTPVQAVNVDGPTSALIGTAITLYASYLPMDATGATLLWDNGTVGEQAEYVWSEVGIHTVVVTATGACGAPVTATYTVTVTSMCMPVQAVNVDGPTSALIGTPVTLYASYTPADATGAMLLWDNGTVGEQAEYVWSEVGVHTVAVVAGGACGLPIIATHVVTVTSICTPIQSVNIDGPTSALSGTTVTLYASYLPVDATGVVLEWDNGTLGESAAYRWSDEGVYTVAITATGACGAPVSTRHTVTVMAAALNRIYLPLVLRNTSS
jgi:heme exporter protein D